MPGTDYDVLIGSYKAKVVRRDDGGYRRRYVRREIEQNLLSQSEVVAAQSRSDRPSMYQTSWAGGAAWWKPLLTPSTLDTYFRSNNMDVWSEPGRVVPMNAHSDAADALIHDNCIIGVGTGGELYAVGETAVTNASFRDVYKWTPGSNIWVREAGYHSGIAVGENPMCMVYDPTDGYFYTLSDGDDLERFSPGGATQSANWVTTGFTHTIGANIFLQNQNLMFYDGEKLYTVTKGGPSVTSVFDDGMGTDFLVDIASNATQEVREANIQLAISTPQGIYYVKNTRQGDQPVAWVFRIDKDASGNWIGNPIANLPRGSVALSIAYHLGQVIISATPDFEGAVRNDGSNYEVVLYFVGEGGMGSLGSILGNRDEVDETPFKILGSRGAHLYVAGGKRLWVYDAIRGGLHSAFEFTTAVTDGPYAAMAFAQDSAGDSILLIPGRNRRFYTKSSQNNPDTVAAFGDDETFYTLESNYFDFGLPMELKELTKVEIQRQADDGGSEWTVQISADDAAFADILEDSGTNSYNSADLNGTTGRRFRYKLIYQVKDLTRKALESLKISATTGEMVQEWHLLLDGDELLNVNNEVQDEQQFYDDMTAIGGTNTTLVLLDNMQEQEQLTDTSGSGIRVKVMAVEIIKEKPGESLVSIVLRED